jgi:predicted hydrocarbon binding protein
MPGRLLDALPLDTASGTLSWENERMLVLPVEALCEIQRGAEESQGDRFATELMASAGFSTGSSLSKRLQHGAHGDERLVAACCEVIAAFGLGRARVALDPKARTLEVEVEGSPFAASFAPAESVSCPFLRGLFTGIAETLFGVGVAGEELTCAAHGAERCRFRSRATQVAEETGWSW